MTENAGKRTQRREMCHIWNTSNFLHLHVRKAPAGDQSIMTVKQSRTHRMCILSGSCFGLSDTEYTLSPTPTSDLTHPITSVRCWMNYVTVRILLRMENRWQ